MINIDKLLKDVIRDANGIGIPISDKIEPIIYIDNKRYDRVAACYKYPFPQKYEIHLSHDTLRSTESEIKNIIAHEVLHTCFLSMDHDYPWKMYKNLMNDKLGYSIQTKYSWHQIIQK